MDPSSIEGSAAVLEQEPAFWLRRLHNLSVLLWKNLPGTSNLGVTPVQGAILMLIRENPGVTQAALARLVSVEPPTLKQALDPLVERSLVIRTQSSADRRRAALTLSDRGVTLCLDIVGGAANHKQLVFGALSPDERDQLRDLLRRAVGGAEQTLRRGTDD